MSTIGTTTAPRWVPSAEVTEAVDRALARAGLSLGEIARRAAERFGADAESVGRRLRAARRPGSVMDVHTADRYLVLVGLHLTDLPSYRDALAGDLPPERWPRRGGGSRAPRGGATARSRTPRAPAGPG
jgi:hypothetical protein